MELSQHGYSPNLSFRCSLCVAVWAGVTNLFNQMSNGRLVHRPDPIPGPDMVHGNLVVGEQ